MSSDSQRVHFIFVIVSFFLYKFLQEPTGRKIVGKLRKQWEYSQNVASVCLHTAFSTKVVPRKCKSLREKPIGIMGSKSLASLDSGSR